MRNMQGLVSFVEAATAGSFTAASARLEVSPAAVGKNVSRLERELGVRLFHRSTRRLKLTAEGEAFLAEAAEALQRLDNAVNRVSQAGSEPAGTVRLSCGITFGRRFVLPLLAPLARRHPGLSLELSLDDRIVDMVAEGCDIAIRGGRFDEDSSLVAKRIGRLTSVLVASPGYLRKHGAPATPRELPQHRTLGLRFASGEFARWRFHKPSRGAAATEWLPNAQLWTSEPDTFIDIAAAGEGICQAALMHAAPLLRSGRLKLVLHGQYDAGDRLMMLCHPSRTLMSRRVRLVTDALWDSLSAQPDLQLGLGDIPSSWLA